jgi:hypothetical protein
MTNHWGQHEADCFGCKLATVRFSHPGAAGGVAKDKRWDQDMAAYSRLRRDGVQPKGIDGSADIEKRATDTFEVDMGMAAQSKKGLNAARSIVNDLNT